MPRLFAQLDRVLSVGCGKIPTVECTSAIFPREEFRHLLPEAAFQCFRFGIDGYRLAIPACRQIG